MCIAFLPYFPWQILGWYADLSLLVSMEWTESSKHLEFSWQPPCVSGLCLQERDISACKFPQDTSGWFSESFGGFIPLPTESFSLLLPPKWQSCWLAWQVDLLTEGTPYTAVERNVLWSCLPAPYCLHTLLRVSVINGNQTVPGQGNNCWILPVIAKPLLSGLQWGARFNIEPKCWVAKCCSSAIDPVLGVRTHQSWCKWVEMSLLLLTSMCYSARNTTTQHKYAIAARSLPKGIITLLKWIIPAVLMLRALKLFSTMWKGWFHDLIIRWVEQYQ